MRETVARHLIFFPLLARTRVIRAFVEMASNRSDRCKVYLAKILIDGHPPPLPVAAFVVDKKLSRRQKSGHFILNAHIIAIFGATTCPKKCRARPAKDPKSSSSFITNYPPCRFPRVEGRKGKKEIINWCPAVLLSLRYGEVQLVR